MAVAKKLLGKLLVRKWPDGRISRHRITEVEAYHGESDLACHASKGRTPRTAVMYQPGGVWYVYLCYGIHEMLNLVTGPADHPAAVLIRGVEGIAGPGRAASNSRSTGPSTARPPPGPAACGSRTMASWCLGVPGKAPRASASTTPAPSGRRSRGGFD